VATTLERRFVGPPVDGSGGGDDRAALCVGLDWAGLIEASSAALECGAIGTKLILVSAHRPRLAWADSMAALLGVQAVDREELATAEISLSDQLPDSARDPIWVGDYSRLGSVVESQLTLHPDCQLVVIGYKGPSRYLRRLALRISARASEFCRVFADGK
jgi:hypothetical protein